MCGFTGFWDFKGNKEKQVLLAIAESMANEIQERGPDSAGTWANEKQGISFGYRRLSVIDLSPAGNQPMHSESGRMVFIYNGEIFNADELRQELIKLGCKFRGHSDSEVILAGCEVWGVMETCQKLIGMFAFALWDETQKKLFLARDRLGIKPLYWGFHKGILFFGSQPKSFFKHPEFDKEIDKEALVSYFRFNYVPAPMSIFKDIQKAMPGCVLSIDEKGKIEEKRFWNFAEIANKGKITPKNDKEAIDQLDALLRDAVKRRMISDVPLGAFLSGGIDSSTVVSLMQHQSNTPVKTFSIGFNVPGFNEAHYAASIAEHLGTEHHELFVESSDAQQVIPDLPKWYDEPFADCSQIPTYLVSKLARQHVTVSLSGDGGDELFAGYNRYLMGRNFWRWIELCPFWIRQLSRGLIRSVPSHRWDNLATILPRAVRPEWVGDKAYKLADILTLPSRQAFYQKCVSFWDDPANLVQLGKENRLYPWTETPHLKENDFIETMQFMDTLTYLPDDILTKVDRASMAVSLEARVPLLDHRVVEYAWTLPMNMKIREGKTKWLLRKVLERYVPTQLTERPKMGFGVPIDTWLRGPLKEWAEYYLSENALRNSGLHVSLIRQRWQEHLSGNRNWQYALWGILMFQTFKEHWKLR